MIEAAVRCATGRIVVVGKTGLPRLHTFFRKEIEVTFALTVGRYDPPTPRRRRLSASCARTERRNIESFLGSAGGAAHRSRTSSTSCARFDQAGAVYDEIDAGRTRAIGVLLDYGVRGPGDARPSRVIGAGAQPQQRAVLAVIGAGNYAASMLLPPLKADARVELRTIITATGLSAANAARRFGARMHGVDHAAVFGDPAINSVVVATRHGSHAALTAAALRSGKAVFVEKPLAIDADGLALVDAAVEQSGNGRLMVGFNRRFAPIMRDLAAAMSGKGPFVLVYRVQAGGSRPTRGSTRRQRRRLLHRRGGHFFDLFRCSPAAARSRSRPPILRRRARPDDRDNIAPWSATRTAASRR